MKLVLNCNKLLAIVSLGLREMETIENLKAQGEALGYEGDALRAFIKDQEDRLRDERKAQREPQARERELVEAGERELAEAAAAREFKRARASGG